MPPTVHGKVAGNLPVELNSFVGRRSETAESRRLLSSSRLVTLTGIGGVGKTRLALRVAADSRRDFANGVWLVELGDLRDPALVAGMVAATLAPRNTSSEPPLGMLAEHLRDRRLLLVIDNCEHVVDAVASLAITLLRSCPGLRILTTSREALAVGGEAVLRVPSLAVPDPDEPPTLQELSRFEAATLFLDRAAVAVPGFVLTEDNRVAVAKICHGLDGLPLAIELAAVRLRTLSADQILDRLSDRYQLLTGGRRGAPSRQQTLRLCIEWSRELCTETERELWGRLTIFSGGFELDAAEGICAGDRPADEVLDVLASLVDKSILICEGAGAVVRYRMLETLREYGREELLAPDDIPVLRRRHLNWYRDLVSTTRFEWIGPRQVELMARLGREQANLREAMHHCMREPDEAEIALQISVALFPFWLSRGLLREGRYWLDCALDLHGDEPTVDRVKALCANSLLAGYQGDTAPATELAAAAQDLAERLDDDALRAAVMHANAYLAAFAGDLPGAVTGWADALSAFRDQGNNLRQISTLLGLTLASGLLGDAAGAVGYQEEALSISERTGEFVYRAYAACALGLALWEADPPRAAGLLEQGLRLSRSADDLLAAAMCVETLAWIACAENQARRAALLLGAVETMWRTVGSPGVVARTLQAYHAECEQQTRRVLGDRAFEGAVREGAGWGPEEAIAFALDELSEAEEERRSPGPASALTQRERQVAELVAQGLTNKAIAAQLLISQRTVQGHVEQILAKLGFASRIQVAAWIVEQGLGRRSVS
ncbi:ATP-binding protein [Rhodococcus sp. UNC363MFTsu5.1]|uniref:ATP-binding protein n=1 Tax=Rhodococcus sp. UNC363MFTsu5.1 TaxID=1449069 RepID=UPI0012DD51CA|nr:LuxR C-terminal-related transcriptional regulator [Rhodococcus sp. UNC363MFTsu5.1]